MSTEYPGVVTPIEYTFTEYKDGYVIFLVISMNELGQLTYHSPTENELDKLPWFSTIEEVHAEIAAKKPKIDLGDKADKFNDLRGKYTQ